MEAVRERAVKNGRGSVPLTDLEVPPPTATEMLAQTAIARAETELEIVDNYIRLADLDAVTADLP